MIKSIFSARRATRDLACAMQHRDLEAMRQAIIQGANLEKVYDNFVELNQMGAMTYQVVGAIKLAIKHDLGPEAFVLLLEAGAPVPRDGNGRARRELLLSRCAPSPEEVSPDVLELINERCQDAPSRAARFRH